MKVEIKVLVDPNITVELKTDDQVWIEGIGPLTLAQAHALQGALGYVLDQHHRLNPERRTDAGHR